MLLWDLRWFYFLAIACGRIWQILCLFNLFLPLWQDYSFALTFKSVDEILWCYHSNESSLGELLLSIIYFLGFYKTKFVSFSDWFSWSSKAVMKFYFEFWQLHIIFFSIQLSKRNSILRIGDFWYVADKKTSLKAPKNTQRYKHVNRGHSVTITFCPDLADVSGNISGIFRSYHTGISATSELFFTAREKDPAEIEKLGPSWIFFAKRHSKKKSVLFTDN